MMKMMGWIAAGVFALPIVTFGQVATREGNIYNGTDHQPTAGGVQSAEKSAGVAPSQQTVQSENRTLGAIDNTLLQHAHRDAEANPSSLNNVFGVQPGGVVTSTPNAVGGGTGGR